MQFVQNVKKNKHDLRQWATRGHMSGWAILGWKSCKSHKLIPRAGISAKWVSADGGNKHFGVDHIAAKYGRSKAEVHT